MAKDKIAYVCSNCGFDSAKWIGKCPACGEWNTFKEFRLGSNSKKTTSRTTITSNSHHLANQDNKPLRLNEISGTEAPRINMNDGELNRVLGGGLVRGSITLLGGEPGIGKSTLTMQTLLSLSHLKVLYVSGEESAYQLKMRAERLSKGLKDTSIDHDNLIILCETSLETIFEQIIDIQPELIIIDSIQTISTEQVESSPGSITQVRECSSQLLRFAKTTNTPVLLIG
ncbi:MAG: AAA family ATPase, partial [Prevotella nanceiensis]|nr:AAA family ATPase [Hoylesella nanceiensis]